MRSGTANERPPSVDREKWISLRQSGRRLPYSSKRVHATYTWPRRGDASAAIHARPRLVLERRHRVAVIDDGQRVRPSPPWRHPVAARRCRCAPARTVSRAGHRTRCSCETACRRARTRPRRRPACCGARDWPRVPRSTCDRHRATRTARCSRACRLACSPGRPTRRCDRDWWGRWRPTPRRCSAHRRAVSRTTRTSGACGCDPRAEQRHGQGQGHHEHESAAPAERTARCPARPPFPVPVPLLPESGPAVPAASPPPYLRPRSSVLRPLSLSSRRGPTQTMAMAGGAGDSRPPDWRCCCAPPRRASWRPPRVNPLLWRGAYHVHSTQSDGSGTPEAIAAPPRRPVSTSSS